MKMNLKVISLVTAIIILAGCATQRFEFNQGPGRLVLKEDQSFVFGGRWQEAQINASGVCGGRSKVVSVEYTYTFSNIMKTIITFGISTPRQVEIYCK